MTNYQVVSDGYLTVLISRVIQFMDNGWICQGGIAVMETENGRIFLQAMIKE